MRGAWCGRAWRGAFPMVSGCGLARRGGLCRCGSGGFAWRSSSKFRNSQSINGIVFSVRADKLHEHDLPTEVECGDQSVVSTSNLEAHAITIKHLGCGDGMANVVHRRP